MCLSWTKNLSIVEIKKGDKISKKNIKVIRPANGLNPFYFDKILNKKSPIDIKKGNPLNNSLLKMLRIKKVILKRSHTENNLLIKEICMRLKNP